MGTISRSRRAEDIRAYPSDRNRATRQVNEEFALAYEAIVECLKQANGIENPRSRALARKLEARATEQLERALNAAAEIDRPQHEPKPSPAPIRISNTAQWMLRSDSQIGDDDLRAWRARAHERDLGDVSTTARNVRGLLALDQQRRVALATALRENTLTRCRGLSSR